MPEQINPLAETNPLELAESELHRYDRPCCLVTGGSSGIGLATAKLFAANGYNIVTCGRSGTALDEAEHSINGASDGDGLCLTTKCDLSHSDASSKLSEFALSNLGRVDVLVNNAALAPLGEFEKIAPSVLDEAINTNIRSVFLLTQKIWSVMKEGSGGTIINISSLAAVDPFPGFSLYGSCKAWIDLLTTALASEGANASIRVCSIRPGAVETPMLRGLFPDFPADQCVRPEDIANKIWVCVCQPDQHPSGGHFEVTNQP